MDFEQAVEQAKKQTGLGVSRASVPDQELVVITYPDSGRCVMGIATMGAPGFQEPGTGHRSATDWGVSLQSGDDVRKLGDAIRVAASAGSVPNELRERALGLGEVDRLKLWGWCIREGLKRDAVSFVHAALVAAVMQVFKVPLGAAGIGVEPQMSPEVQRFYDDGKLAKQLAQLGKKAQR